MPGSTHQDERFLLSRSEFVPAYLELHQTGQLKARGEQALEWLRACRVCPRRCEIDRLRDKTAVCRSGRYALVASAFPHLGEEDCLRGWRGSGTIFFGGCNLNCVFCQNYQTSQAKDGMAVGPEELAALMLELQQTGCHNINFVTPEHVVPQILEALPRAVEGGLRIPLVYNTSGYDSLESLRLMDGVVDIYMPDFKLWDPGHSAKYLLARDYPESARQAIQAMHRQVGVLMTDQDGLALRGLLIRHLVMPGLLDDTAEILRWLARNLSPDTYVNLMDQYRPAWKARTENRYAGINRPLSRKEYKQALDLAQAAGLWRFDTR